MHWRITALWRGKRVGLRETQREVTPFTRLAVFFAFLYRSGSCEAVRQHVPFSQLPFSQVSQGSHTPVCRAPTPPCAR